MINRRDFTFSSIWAALTGVFAKSKEEQHIGIDPADPDRKSSFCIMDVEEGVVKNIQYYYWNPDTKKYELLNNPLEKTIKWIPVEKGSPECDMADSHIPGRYSRTVLVAGIFGVAQAHYYENEGYGTPSGYKSGPFKLFGVTHWAEMPSGPTPMATLEVDELTPDNIKTFSDLPRKGDPWPKTI